MNEMEMYTRGNSDNISNAVAALSIFTHNFCMDVAATEAEAEPIFRCKDCEFRTEDDYCLVKKFANNHQCKYSDFVGCMSR